MVKEKLNDIIVSVCAVENECNYKNNPLNLLDLTYICEFTRLYQIKSNVTHTK